MSKWYIWVLSGIIMVILYNCKKKPTESDTQPPTVSIIKPINGETIIQRQDTIKIDAQDNEGVVKVELYIDNMLRSTYTTPPYEYIWNLTEYPSGSSHNVYARAYDKANNVGTSSTITVKVINRDTIFISKNEGGLDIPDGSYINSVIPISQAPSGAVIGWVKVEVNIIDLYPDYPCISIYLKTPSSSFIFIGDDTSPFPLVFESPSIFAGGNVNGQWTLQVSDECPDGYIEGYLQEWKLWVEWKF
ncbi:MAG: Ig-like domain-containing protein [candidate division WOR-3 bacterium]